MADLYTYPKLQEILPIDKIPNFLLGIEDLANILTDKLFYKNYYSSVSSSKHSGFHKLTLITGDELGFDIGGSGLTLLLNPSTTGTGGSEIPLTLIYKWDILKYIYDFKINKFDGSAKAYFEIILQIVGISKSDLIHELCLTLIDDNDPLNRFVNDFNMISMLALLPPL